MGNGKYPQTKEEAFAIIDSLLTDEEKRIAVKQKTSDWSTDQHFDLGVWIRNNWIYKGNVPYEVLTGEKAPSIEDGILIPFIKSPDDISGKFLELYHKHLKKTFKP